MLLYIYIFIYAYLYIKGHGKIGRLGFGNESTQFNLKTLRINNCQIKDFSVGYNHTLFIGSNGELFTCGDNTFGQLGKLNMNFELYIE